MKSIITCAAFTASLIALDGITGAMIVKRYPLTLITSKKESLAFQVRFFDKNWRTFRVQSFFFSEGGDERDGAVLGKKRCENVAKRCCEKGCGKVLRNLSLK